MSIKELYYEFIEKADGREMQDGYELSNGVSINYKQNNDSIDLVKINKDGIRTCYTIFDAIKDGVNGGRLYLNIQDKNGDLYKSNSIEELVIIFNKIC